jgi:hypothetical protein
MYVEGGREGYFVDRDRVATVAEAERWLAHLDEKGWAHAALPELLVLFEAHLGQTVRLRTHDQLNAEHGFRYGQS